MPSSRHKATARRSRAHPRTAPASPDGWAIPKRQPVFGSTLNAINPLAALPHGRNRRVSSNQQPGWNSENLDMTWLLPGQSVDMPVLRRARRDHAHLDDKPCRPGR